MSRKVVTLTSRTIGPYVTAATIGCPKRKLSVPKNRQAVGSASAPPSFRMNTSTPLKNRSKTRLRDNKKCGRQAR